jgi:hypothetical protein
MLGEFNNAGVFCELAVNFGRVITGDAGHELGRQNFLLFQIWKIRHPIQQFMMRVVLDRNRIIGAGGGLEARIREAVGFGQRHVQQRLFRVD